VLDMKAMICSLDIRFTNLHNESSVHDGTVNHVEE